MYAVIQSGGKQYKVTNGESLSVEKLSANAGDKVVFDEVLMASGENGVVTGSPFIKGAKVTAEVVEQYFDKKLMIFTYKPKIHVRKKQGHRQPYTLVKITGIEL